MGWAKPLAVAALAFVLATALAGPSVAEEPDSLVVARAAICTGIEEREPAGADTVFSKDVGKLYCFTQVEGARDSTYIEHVWYHKDREMARVKLAIRSPRWRTWSSKKISEEWTGVWSVEVLSADGKLLKKLRFQVK